jgi:hypothetical protein
MLLSQARFEGRSGVFVTALMVKDDPELTIRKILRKKVEAVRSHPELVVHTARDRGPKANRLGQDAGYAVTLGLAPS